MNPKVDDVQRLDALVQRMEELESWLMALEPQRIARNWNSGRSGGQRIRWWLRDGFCYFFNDRF